ncbi:MAG: hypothetical protein MMC23_000650 [Stictis urceolatum]|nr:hypothetical protein [Stictis urceolata]
MIKYAQKPISTVVNYEDGGGNITMIDVYFPDPSIFSCAAPKCPSLLTQSDWQIDDPDTYSLNRSSQTGLASTSNTPTTSASIICVHNLAASQYGTNLIEPADRGNLSILCATKDVVAIASYHSMQLRTTDTLVREVYQAMHTGSMASLS